MDIFRDFLNKSKNDILDPLSIIVKLFIYSYKPIGTKIAIINNKLVIQEMGLFQGPLRLIYGDSKNDINIIFFPIVYACDKYLSSDKKSRYILLFTKLIESFKKLKETYLGNEITYNIDQLENIITTATEIEHFDPLVFISTYHSPNNKIKQNIYEHLNSIWTERRIRVIFGYIDEILETTSPDLQNLLLLSLTNYMNYIDSVVINIITNL
jgi:hypothetical protein